MAEIVDQLRLDITQALRDVDRLESNLDRALAPIEIEIEVDDRSTQELESTLREVERIAGRAATEVASIDLAAGRAETNFEDLARAMGITEERARDVTRELLESQAAANRLEDAARDVARQLGLSDTEANRLAGSLREADRAADAIDVAAVGLGTRFASLRSTIGLMAGALAGIGGGAVLGGALIGANNAIQAFARLEDSVNAVRVVFGTAGEDVLKIGENAAASAGLSQEAFNQAVVPIGGMLQNLGFDAATAAESAAILVQRGADLASVYGGTVQDALLAVGAALRGEADPLERYSASISQARVEQFLLAEGFAKTKAEITPALILQGRYGLILSDTARVAGDYAATAGDLANAQRTAGATAANFGTDVGEVLAPALEDLVALLPGVLEGVRQLIPAFATTADSAATFFESMGEGGGFRAEGAGLGAFLDAATAGGGILLNFGGVVAGVGRDFLDLDESMNDTAAAADRLNVVLEQPIRRGIALKFAAALDRGADAAKTFGQAMAATAGSTKSLETFEKSFRDLAIAANLSQPQLQGATRDLLANRAALGLTAPEVKFLTGQLNALNEELDTGGRANPQFLEDMRAIAADGAPAVTTLQDLQGAAADLGPAIADLVTGTGPLAGLLTGLLTPSQELDRTFDLLSEDVTTAASLFQDTLTPSIVDTTEALQNFGEDGKLSLDEFITGLEETAIAAANFRSNLLTILATTGGAELFEELRNMPADVAAILAEEAVSTGRIEETAAAIIGNPEDLAAEFDRIQREALAILRHRGPEQANQFILGSVALFEDEQIQDDLRVQLNRAVERSKTDVGNFIERAFQQDDALNRAAGFTADHYTEQVIDRFGLRAFVFGDDIGAIIEAGFTQEGAASTAANLTADAYEEDLLAGLEAMDPAALEAALSTVLFGFDIDLTSMGAEARSTFIDGLSIEARDEVSRVRGSIVRVMDAAENRSSPPKLFLDYGVEAGETFWSGFEQADMSLRLPTPSFTGTVSGTDPAAVGGGGNTEINFSLPNLETRDADTTIARAAQLMSSVAGILNGRFKL